MNNVVDSKQDKMTEQLTWTLTPEQKLKVANTGKLPSTKVEEIKANQESGVAEKIPESQANALKSFIDTYAKNPKFDKLIKTFVIDWGANGENFIAFGPRQKQMEKSIAKVTESLGVKWYDWKSFIQKQWLVLPPKLWNEEWSLNDQLANLPENQQSDLLNKWLSITRAFQMLDAFTGEQIKTISPKLDIKAKPYENISTQLKFASFNTLINSEILEKDPTPWEIKFKFSELSSVQSWTEGGVYNKNLLKANIFSLWSILNRKSVDTKTNVSKSTIRRSDSDGMINAPDHRVGQGIWPSAVRDIIGGSFYTWKWLSWEYFKKIYSDLDNFSALRVTKNDNISKQIVNGNERIPNTWPLYEVNIFANKIGPDHWLNNYFDIKKEKNPVSWNEEIKSISMKKSLRSGDVAKDYITSLEILKKVYDEQKISDTKFDAFFADNKQRMENKKTYNDMIATGFVKEL